MRLSLTDIKKSITRRDGEIYIVPYLIGPRTLTRQLEALIDLYATFVGKPRADFPLDRPLELIGDYRLARSLVACLSEWYVWQAPSWPGGATPAEAQALAALDIVSPGHLRLALYNHVNATAGGYLSSAQRESALDAFAAKLSLARPTVDELLTLDADDRAVLCQESATAKPTARQVATRYNQRVVEALLTSASVVEWRLPADAQDGDGAGLGTIIKRMCFLARRMGVYYDISFDETSATSPAQRSNNVQPLPQRQAYLRVAEQPAPYGVNVPAPLSKSSQPLRVTLYGPQEVMGAPNQYGDRLARLCRALLGYRRSSNDADANSGKIGNIANSPLAVDANAEASAQVYLHGRPLTFILDERLLRLLQNPHMADEDDEIAAETAKDNFDSNLERGLATNFAALERAGEAHGWRLEREPEPIIVGDTIMIPDFTLTRGPRRIYLEIAGYWRPGYRERKARKLATLRGSVALVVAAPESARAEFSALADDMPFLWYKNHLSAQALLALVDRVYDDLSERLATLDPSRIAAEVAQRGHIPPTESMALLHVYTRTELAAALQRLTDDPQSGDKGVDILWLESVGLCHHSWRDTLMMSVRSAVANAPTQRLPLAQLLETLANQRSDLSELTEPLVEELATSAGLAVVRHSIFEVEIMLPEAAIEAASTLTALPTPPRQPQPRRPARRKQHSRTSTSTTIQSCFVAEIPGDEDPPA